ncbi:T9SS type A sorting domain-containing protein [Kaistella sp. PBT33-4]|uniref:T9SS type A sorting domain-containing protein n=1 Tax=Kaistella sp. PBT33-4 TaxID=3032000 RepID=UPI0023D8519D|nr:T9SS type A sorting domain-containing protein [Kaistella sp. PBT33-4]MDF0719973.1 T9SS type A sorting domain-containing protein [Kaistella sp. PBT33-4]
MKKSILLITAFTGMVSAQTTITKAFNDPVVGETVNNVTVNGTVDNSATGAGVTFQNGSLTQGAATATTYTAPSASELTTFPGSTIKMNGLGNTVLYKQTATKLEITGLITPDATLNFSVNNGTVITYPAAFGYNETDQAQGTFTSSAASGIFKGTITNTADAAGTLILGSQTYPNVLRLKSVQNLNLHQSSDILFLVPIGTVTNTTYTYYDNVRKFPILSYTSANISVPLLGINQTTTGAQALNEVFLSTVNADPASKLQIFPNPAQETIHLTGETSRYSDAKIFATDGKLVRSRVIKEGKVEVSDLPAGVYFLEISGPSVEARTLKFIKK